MENQSSAALEQKNLVRYGVQLAMLNKLKATNMIDAREYGKIKERLMKDYKFTSNDTCN